MPLWANIWSDSSINICLFLDAEKPILLENILIDSIASSPCLNGRGVLVTHRYSTNHPALQFHITYSSVSPVLGATSQSPTPAGRDSTWRDERCWRWDSLSIFYGLPVYSKFKILFYTFTKALGQRFDIFSSPSPRFIISINHCCSSEFLLQWFSGNQPYHLLSTFSNVSCS